MVGEITTPRLLLRQWRSSDRQPFSEMNADPRVMEFFPAPLSREESEALVDRIEQHFADHGFGIWAVEIPDLTPFAGFVGLAIPRFDAHFTPCVEIGWRLAARYWGLGFATEAARAVLNFAFGRIHLDEVVSMTSKCNERSRGVMQRIGMTYSSLDDFLHPLVPKDHRLAPHVLYRARRISDRSA
jgi:RimJ/RimL family protein N-acetyltransferase